VTAASVIKGTLVVALVGAGFGLGMRVGEQRARDEFALLPPKTITVEVPVPVAAAPQPTVVEPAPVDPAPTPPSGPVKPKPAKNEPDALQAELAVLQVARERLAAGDAEGTLKAIAKYDAAFPHGTMRTDAQLTRLDALLLAGRRADAETLGKRILAETDSELVRDRVRRRLDAR